MTEPAWFDRINRYRVAAAVLYVPFLAQLGAWAAGTQLRDLLPAVATRSIYWTGLLLLTVALAPDAWAVYSGKRQVNRLINQKKRERRSGKSTQSG